MDEAEDEHWLLQADVQGGDLVYFWGHDPPYHYWIKYNSSMIYYSRTKNYEMQKNINMSNWMLPPNDVRIDYLYHRWKFSSVDYTWIKEYCYEASIYSNETSNLRKESKIHLSLHLPNTLTCLVEEYVSHSNCLTRAKCLSHLLRTSLLFAPQPAKKEYNQNESASLLNESKNFIATKGMYTFITFAIYS